MREYDAGLDAWVEADYYRPPHFDTDPDRDAWQVQRGTDWITALALVGLFLLVLATVGAGVWLVIFR